jgi:hypothetical protein
LSSDGLVGVALLDEIEGVALSAVPGWIGRGVVMPLGDFVDVDVDVGGVRG